MGDPVPSITVTDFTDTAHEGDADDEYFDSHEEGLSRTSSTFTQKVIFEEVTAADGSTRASGQITEQVTEVAATKPTGDAAKQPASQRVKVSQTTGTITGQLPNSKDAKQVKISGQVTEVTATQGPTNQATNQTPVPGTGPGSGPGTGTSTPRSSKSIRKALSAVLDGSPFRSSFSNNETMPRFRNWGGSDSPQQSTPKPKPMSQTPADPPRPPMLGYEWVWFPAGYWAEREIAPRPAKGIRRPKWVRRSLQYNAGSTHGTPLPSAPRSLNPSEVWARHPGDVDDELEEMAGDGFGRRRASTPPGRMSPDKGTSTPKSLLQKLQQISHSRKASESGPSNRKGKV